MNVGTNDIVNDLDGVLGEFDRVLGLKLLKAIHLNDSMMPFGANKDRHETFGNGCIGMETLMRIVKHPKLKEIPFYLETPLDDEGHKEEIQMIKEKL
jgi:deoxyribonuclease-4